MTSAKQPSPSPPVCLAMVLSDSIWRDSSTGKYTILGTCGGISSERFPADHGPLAVFYVLTDGRGTIPVSLRLLDAEDEREEPLFSYQATLCFHHPAQVVEGHFLMPKINFPRAGKYRFQLRRADQVLLERSFEVTRREHSRSERRSE